MNQAKQVPIWLGITDKNTEGSFETIDGQALDFTNFGNASLDNLNFLDGDYVVMTNEGKWYDVSSDSYAYALCVFERKIFKDIMGEGGRYIYGHNKLKLVIISHCFFDCFSSEI